MSHTFGRDEILRSLMQEWTPQQLFAFAGACDVDPAEEDVCDACYAYILAQDKEEENES